MYLQALVIFFLHASLSIQICVSQTIMLAGIPISEAVCFSAKQRGQRQSVMIRDSDILFSIICLPPLLSDSLLTFTISIMFFTSTFCDMIW